MNRAETLEWIELILGALDKHEMIAIIRESADEFDGAFFETLDQETARYTTEGEAATAARLTEIGRTIAAIRQNRNERL